MTIEQRLQRIETLLQSLLEKQQTQQWYTTDQFAQIVGKAEYTVREWCRHGRIHAEKQGSGRGRTQSWVVSHEELRRYQKEGLLVVNANNG